MGVACGPGGVQNFQDGDKNTVILDHDATLSGYQVVDATGAPIPRRFPISLNNLPFLGVADTTNGILGTVDDGPGQLECLFVRSHQDSPLGSCTASSGGLSQCTAYPTYAQPYPTNLNYLINVSTKAILNSKNLQWPSDAKSRG